MGFKKINNFLQILFSSLRNGNCVEIVKKYKILPFFFLFITIFFLILPVVIVLQQKNGSDWLRNNSYIYDIDIGLTKFSEYNNKNKKLKLLIQKDSNNQHFINITQSDWNESFEKDSHNIHTFIWKRINRRNNEKIYLKIFFIDTASKKEFNYFVNNIIKTYTDFSSFIVFGKYNVFCCLYKSNEKKIISYITGNYNKIGINTNLLTDFYVPNNNVETLNKWMVFFDKAFYGEKPFLLVTSALNNVTIYIFYIFLLSIMLWVLNKQKNKFSFSEYRKIIYCFGFVLSIIAFFIDILFNTYSINVFLFLLSMRTMVFNTNYINTQNNKQQKDDLK
ncbi:MAG: hypothetical protein J6Y70_01660 [Bacilli bacterium]|nr:hypothetical protein [Bacilli bacterium]